MKEYIPQLAKAILIRKSRRKYLDKKLTDEHEKKLDEFIRNIKAPFEHSVEIAIHRLSESVLFFRTSNVVAGFSAPTELLDQTKLGFIGELFVLYCQSLRIGTCWVGRFKKNTYELIKTKEHLYCITPLGYSPDQLGLMEKVTHALVSGRKNTVEQHLHNDSLKEFPDYIRKALELACKSPSAINAQPWYFKVAKNSVEISKSKGNKRGKWLYPYIDVGICAAHFWLGLSSQRIDFDISTADDADRVIWRFIIKTNL